MNHCSDLAGDRPWGSRNSETGPSRLDREGGSPGIQRGFPSRGQTPSAAHPGAWEERSGDPWAPQVSAKEVREKWNRGLEVMEGTGLLGHMHRLWLKAWRERVQGKLEARLGNTRLDLPGVLTVVTGHFPVARLQFTPGHWKPTETLTWGSNRTWEVTTLWSGKLDKQVSDRAEPSCRAVQNANLTGACAFPPPSVIGP